MKIKVNEFLFSLYIFSFSIFRNIFPIGSSLNNYVVNMMIILLLFISILYNRRHIINKINVTFICISKIVLIIFLYNYLFYYNNNMFQYFKDFILFGLIAMYFYVMLEDKQYCLYYMALFSSILIITSFNDPINNYIRFGGYMSYGLFCTLPSFCCIHIVRKYYKKKYLIIFEIISIIGLLIYSNRNSMLTAITLVVLLDLLFVKNDIKKYMKYIIISIVIGVIFYNRVLILEKLLDITEYKSYSLKALYNMFTGVNNGLTGRDDIWINCIEFLNKNILFGNGIGMYESYYGYYTHNIFWDILTTFGLLGGIPLITIIFIIILKMLKNKKRLHLFDVLILILGIVPLIFNTYYMRWNYFWIYIIYGIELLRREAAN